MKPEKTLIIIIIIYSNYNKFKPAIYVKSTKTLRNALCVHLHLNKLIGTEGIYSK